MDIQNILKLVKRQQKSLDKQQEAILELESEKEEMLSAVNALVESFEETGAAFFHSVFTDNPVPKYLYQKYGDRKLTVYMFVREIKRCSSDDAEHYSSRIRKEVSDWYRIYNRKQRASKVESAYVYPLRMYSVVKYLLDNLEKV